MVESLQHEVICRQALRGSPPCPQKLPLSNVWCHRTDDANRDASLQLEQIVEFTLIHVRADHSASLSVTELCLDVQASVRAPHIAIQHVTNPQVSANGADIYGCSAVAEHRAARDDK